MTQGTVHPGNPERLNSVTPPLQIYQEMRGEAQALSDQAAAFKRTLGQLRMAASVIEAQRTEFKGFLDGSRGGPCDRFTCDCAARGGIFREVSEIGTKLGDQSVLQEFLAAVAAEAGDERDRENRRAVQARLVHHAAQIIGDSLCR